MSVTVKLRIPGTTANCGPGFDAVGIACTIYNELELTLSDEPGLVISIEGEGKDLLPLDDTNIVVMAIRAVFTKAGMCYNGIKIKMLNHIPMARGLGSSAAAIVGGVVAANRALGSPLSQQDLLEMATKMEGHPDNVAPALLGGMALSIMQNDHVESLRFVPPDGLKLVVVVPDFTLSTAKARAALPKTVPYKDAVFNVSRTALLIGAFCQGQYKFLKYALEDKLHQPYREHLIPGMSEVFKAAETAGAYGAAISGAGSCLIAFTSDHAEEIGIDMVQAFATKNISAKYLVLDVDPAGATVI